MSRSIDISYIVPVYNAMPYLKKCVSSLVGQTYPAERVELIFVDDGSSDGSGEFLDEQAALHGNIQVVHTPPSGGPGRPRNIGLDRAQGEYVFFCDADDWMELDATAAMLAHAKEWGSDVLLVRPKGENGRTVAKAFDETLPKADIYESSVGLALGPCKLFRREFLEKHTLKFNTNLSVFEDQPFVLSAYLLAETVSIAADRVYCHWVVRDDGGNATGNRKTTPFVDVESYLTAVFAAVDTYADLERAKIALAPRVLREGLFYAARSLAREPEALQEELFARLRSRVLPYVGEGCYRMFNAQRSLALKAFEAGDMQSWMDICAVDSKVDSTFSVENFISDDAAKSITAVWDSGDARYEIDARGRVSLDAEVTSCVWRGNGVLELQGTCDARATYGASSVQLKLNSRGAGNPYLFDTNFVGEDQDGRQAWCAGVEFSMLGALAEFALWDAALVVEYDNGRQRANRLKVAVGACGFNELSLATPGVALFAYETKKNGFSLWNPLLDARVHIERTLLNATACLEGLPKRAAKKLGTLQIEVADGARSKRFEAISDMSLELGFSLRKARDASVIVRDGEREAAFSIPVCE